MLTVLLAAGYIAGILTCLLLLKILPVKISFAWGQDSVYTKAKGRVRKLHPKYCAKCDAIPCQDQWSHKYDDN